jgi:methionyl-tRNA formyltransferase
MDHPVALAVRSASWPPRCHLAHTLEETKEGVPLFLLSWPHKIKPLEAQRFVRVFVLHCSDLPRGRGWSPHIWDILEGKDVLTLSCIEAADPIDSGDIWAQTQISVAKTDLWDDINAKIFAAEIGLIHRVIGQYDVLSPTKQEGHPTFFRRRSREDSMLDTSKCISEQWDLMRVCDPLRYPAWFEIYGQKYKIRIEKC